jgi:uncharacterized membrane protein
MNRRPGVYATAAAVLVMAAFSIWAAPQLPERVPSHWNAAGEVDGYSGRIFALVMLPLMALGIGLLLYALPRLDPRRRNLEASATAYNAVWVAVLLVLTGVHVMVLLTGLGWEVPVGTLVLAGVGLLFLVIGGTIGEVRSNWFLGIRTPWTMSSERSWERTHRLGGRLFLALGALALLSVPFGPQIGIWVIAAGAAAVVLVLFAYSYIVWRDDPSRA